MKALKLTTLIILVSVLLVSGCSRQHYGNFSNLSLDQNSIMAESVATRLSTLYPPALTKINMKMDVTDAFGKSLINQLRDRGYSVQEYSGKGQDRINDASPGENSKYQGSIDLSYIVDSLGIQDFYRVTINIGKQSISRGFVVDNSGKVSSAGAWVRKE